LEQVCLPIYWFFVKISNFFGPYHLTEIRSPNKQSDTYQFCLSDMPHYSRLLRPNLIINSLIFIKSFLKRFETCPLLSANTSITMPGLRLGIVYHSTATRARSAERKIALTFLFFISFSPTIVFFYYGTQHPPGIFL